MASPRIPQRNGSAGSRWAWQGRTRRARLQTGGCPTAHLGCPPCRPQIVARNSYVDDTLFGCSKAACTRSPGKLAGAPCAGSSPSPTRRPVATASHIVGRDGSVMLSKSQLDRMMQVRCRALASFICMLAMDRVRVPMLSSCCRAPASFPLWLLQKSPILTPAELEQLRAEAEKKLEEELVAAKAARAARDKAAAEAERAAAAQPKTEMARLREKERREAISRAQLTLLVGKRGFQGGGGLGAGRALPPLLQRGNVISTLRPQCTLQEGALTHTLSARVASSRS